MGSMLFSSHYTSSMPLEVMYLEIGRMMSAFMSKLWAQHRSPAKAHTGGHLHNLLRISGGYSQGCVDF